MYMWISKKKEKWNIIIIIIISVIIIIILKNRLFANVRLVCWSSHYIIVRQCTRNIVHNLFLIGGHVIRIDDGE